MNRMICIWLFSLFFSGFNNEVDSFFGRANQIHSGIISAGKLAVLKGNKDIKKMATQLISDHTQAQHELLAILKTQKLNTDSKPDSIGQATLVRLTQVSGRQFDSVYMASQFTELKEEEILYSEESKNGSNEKVKAYAGKYLPKVQMHLQQFTGHSSAITPPWIQCTNTDILHLATTGN